MRDKFWETDLDMITPAVITAMSAIDYARNPYGEIDTMPTAAFAAKKRSLWVVLNATQWVKDLTEAQLENVANTIIDELNNRGGQ